MSDPPVTNDRIATYLLAELARRGGVLHEDVAALEIVRLFGGDFCERGPGGAFRVSKDVRDAFDRLAVYAQRRVLWSDTHRTWSFGAMPPSPYR